MHSPFVALLGFERAGQSKSPFEGGVQALLKVLVLLCSGLPRFVFHRDQSVPGI